MAIEKIKLRDVAGLSIDKVHCIRVVYRLYWIRGRIVLIYDSGWGLLSVIVFGRVILYV